MYAHEEAAFEKKADRHFKSHRELPNGRSYLWERERFLLKSDRENFRTNFDQIRFDQDPPGKGL